MTGRDRARNNRNAENDWWRQRGGDPQHRMRDAIVDEGAGGGWQKAFEQSAGAYMSRAMPQFRQQMQLTREDGIARGISTGDLGTSYEGDLASAFQQNTSDTLGSMAMGAYENNRNRYLDLLTGHMDRKQGQRNAKNQMWSGLGSAVSGALPFLF